MPLWFLELSRFPTTFCGKSVIYIYSVIYVCTVNLLLSLDLSVSIYFYTFRCPDVANVAANEDLITRLITKINKICHHILARLCTL